MDLALSTSVVLVTGGSDGLGLATARTLLAEGARVGICGRDPERLVRAAESLADGDRVFAFEADVTETADLGQWVDQAAARWGRIDGVVNNAGRAAAASAVEVTDEEWRADLDLKLVAAAALAREARPWLEASPHGSIVNVLAIGGKAPGAASAPSSVSRAAGLAMTKAMSKDLGPFGVRVNAVLVGLVESGQWERRAAAAGISTEEQYRSMAASSGIPMGRVGRAAEFADVVAFLLSPRSGYVTGSSINIDGGLSPVV